jgi:molybdopterin synthase catalytic subunit
MIRVQEADFDPAAELATLIGDRTDIGAVVTFTGLVRDLFKTDASNDTSDHGLSAMTLEHYPGMTEKMLGDIDDEANRRWPLSATLIIHRYGRMEPGERIVHVITASAHRHAAYEANMFLMDWLKTKAPFWKLEEDSEGENWVAARDSDDDAAERWSKQKPKAAE